jgi:hypothetical protein
MEDPCVYSSLPLFLSGPMGLCATVLNLENLSLWDHPPLFLAFRLPDLRNVVGVTASFFAHYAFLGAARY